MDGFSVSRGGASFVCPRHVGGSTNKQRQETYRRWVLRDHLPPQEKARGASSVLLCLVVPSGRASSRLSLEVSPVQDAAVLRWLSDVFLEQLFVSNFFTRQQ